MKELNVEAKDENLQQVLDFVNEQLEAFDCAPQVQFQVEVAVEEIFVNISHYAYNPEVGPATIRAEVSKDPLSVTLTFMDHGKPFDPLVKSDPDVSDVGENDEIGGLGIFMVKKSMDYVDYEYKDGQNILTIKKNLSTKG